jgi:hypothetical protein
MNYIKGVSMEDIIIEETNYKAFALILANLFLLLATIAIAAYGNIKHKPGIHSLGILGVTIFFLGLIASMIKGMQVKKLLTITMDGIVDSSSIGGIGFISFDDIKDIQIVSIYNKKAIAVIPKNMDSFLSKLTMVKRRQVKRNLYLNLPPVAINVEMAKDMEPEDILSLLQKRLLDYSRLYE